MIRNTLLCFGTFSSRFSPILLLALLLLFAVGLPVTKTLAAVEADAVYVHETAASPAILSRNTIILVENSPPKISISSSTTTTIASCSTFASRCLLTPGVAVAIDAFNLIRKPAGASLYFHFTASTDDFFISLPVHYGELSVFVRSEKEPKPITKPYNNVGGVVRIDKTMCAVGKACNLLVKTVQTSLFTIHAYTATAPLALLASLPVHLNLYADVPEIKLSYIVGSQINNTLTKFSLTSLTSSLLSSVSADVSYSSDDHLQTASANSSFIMLRMKQNPLAGKTMLIKLKALQSIKHIFSSSLVVIAPSTTVSAVHLLDGYPFYGKVRAKECNFFRITIPKAAAGIAGYTLDIYLELIVGDADLFANPKKSGFYEHRASEQLSTFSSLRTDNRDRISIDIGAQYDVMSDCLASSSTTGAPSVDCEVLVTVYGFAEGESEFILRSELSNTPTVLTEGFQYRGSVSARSYKYFAFFDSDTSRTLVFDVAPISGDSDLFISCLKSLTGTDSGLPSRLTGHYNASSQDYLEDALEITTTDMGRNCKPSKKSYWGNGVVYYIAIYGFYLSEFSLVARWKGSQMILRPGVAIEDSVLHGLDSIYKLHLGSVPQELRVLLTPLSDGDPDLFLTQKSQGAYSATNSKESVYLSYEYRSSKTGRNPDEIVVPEAEVCTNCVVTIAVHGYNTARYSIIATLSDTSVSLVLGASQRGSANLGKSQMYSFRAPVSGRYMVTLTVFSGHPVLLASLTQKEPSISDKEKDTLRSDTNNVVYIDVDVPTNNSSAISGRNVFLSVVPSMNQNTSYSVRASALLLHQVDASVDVYESMLLRLVPDSPQSEVIDLRIGNSDAGTFKGWLDWRYYSIVAPIGNEDILIRATALAGNVDLFVGKQTGITTCFPNTTHHLASTVDQAYDNMRIRRSDLSPTRYIVGAHISSDSSYLIYSISYSLDKGMTLVLQDGVPVLDHVTEGEADYYSFMVRSYEKDTSIRIAVTPLVGDPDVYVSTVVTQPGPFNYSWRSIEFGADVLDISTSSKGQQQQAKNAPSSHSTDDDTVSAGTDDGGKKIGYDGGIGCSGCAYYIAVDGVRESTYTISATLSSTLPRLISGSPQSGRVEAGAWTYYLLSASFAASEDLHLTLTNRLGDSDLYVNIAVGSSNVRRLMSSSGNYVGKFVETSVEGVDKPTLFHYDYKSIEHGLNTEELTILHSDAIAKSCIALHVPCIVTIGVYGIQTTDFSVVTSSISSTILVQQGHPVSGSVPLSAAEDGKDRRQYYRVLLSGSQFGIDSSNASNVGKYPPAPMQFTFTVYSGSIGVALSCRVKKPNSTSAEFYFVVDSISSTTVSSYNNSYSFSLPSISLIDSGCSLGSQLFIGIENRTSWRAQFVMVASEASLEMTALEPGVTLFADVALRKFEYYYIRPGAGFDDILISATPLSGDIDVFVSRSWDKRPVLDRSGKTTSFSIGSTSLGSENLLLDHDWVMDTCSKRPQCYIVVGVLGVFDTGSQQSGQGNRYMLTATLKDSARQLIESVPTRGHADKGRYEYFTYPISQLDFDVIISLSVYTGDVDLFLSLGSMLHPTRYNYTWSSGYIGSDAITIQNSDLAKVCRSKLAYNLPCDLHIAVYGFANSSYSVLAVPDAGFLNPILLTEHDTQQRSVKLGAYSYFAFIVPPLDKSRLTDSIRITLSCLSGDADLFVSLSSTTTGEPGRYKYDYKSSNFGSIVDEVEIRPGGLPLTEGPFCVDCTIYIAVYGYADASYTLSATLRGVQSLLSGVSVGGHVGTEGMRYYSFANTDPSAKISISLSSIQGDADLYVSTVSLSLEGDKTNLPLPTVNHYTWHSQQLGEDAIRISYSDPKFCCDCFYIIGVFGYQNCTYSLLAVETESTAIRLSIDRPTSFQMTRAQQRHFLVIPSNDVDDLILSATALDRGKVDLFTRAVNISIQHLSTDDDVALSWRNFPDPSISSSYDMTTRGTGRVSITLHPYAPLHGHGQAATSSPIVYMITVLASEGDVSGTLLASSSARHILLTPGTPQNHFVEEGHTAFFSYYPTADPLDALGASTIRVSVVPITGDPDLLISANPFHPKPQCISSSTTPDSLSVLCYNYTWMSRMFNADQVVISGDYPCEPLLTSTITSSNCAADILHGLAKSNAPLFIGVFGYRSTSFTITVSAGQTHQYILAGQPQPAVLSIGHSCYTRSSKTGICMDSLTGDALKSSQIDVAYFTFKVSSKGADDLLGEVILTVIPHCNASSYSSSECAPGCMCNQLKVFVRSCGVSSCNSQDAMPSSFDRSGTAAMTVSSALGSSLFIDPVSPVHCDPNVRHETCVYFVAVQSTTFSGLASTFTITTRTPGDVVLVPCKQNPDGINFYHVEDIGLSSSSSSILTANPNSLFEICANQYSSAIPSSSVRVTVERCYGPQKLALYACGATDGCLDVVPSSRSWKYYSDGLRNCVNYDASLGQSSHTLSCQNGLGVPDLSLPYSSSSGNFFLSLEGSNGGRGRFQLVVRTEIGGKELPSPSLVRHSSTLFPKQRQNKKELESFSDSIDLIVKASIDGTNVNFEWDALSVKFPGITSGSSSSSSPATSPIYVSSSDIIYSLLVSPTLENDNLVAANQVAFYTSCGVEYAASALAPDATSKGVFSLTTYMYAPDETSGMFKRRLAGLLPHTEYEAFLVATCDSSCLQILGKRHHELLLGVDCCGEKGDICKPQSLVFKSAKFTTGKRSSSEAAVDDRNSAPVWSWSYIFMYSAIVLAIIGVLLLLIYYWKHSGDGLGLDFFSTGFTSKGQSEMVATSHGSSHGLTSGRVSSGNKNMFGEDISRKSNGDGGNSNNSYVAPNLSSVSNFWNSTKDKIFGSSRSDSIANRPSSYNTSYNGGSSNSWTTEDYSPIRTNNNSNENTSQRGFRSPGSRPNSGIWGSQKHEVGGF